MAIAKTISESYRRAARSGWSKVGRAVGPLYLIGCGYLIMHTGPHAIQVLAELSISTNEIPRSPLDVGGFKELHAYGYRVWKIRAAEVEQAKYLRDSAELRRTVLDCDDPTKVCDPSIRLFHEMLVQVRSLPTRQLQIETVNAWINLLIDYDWNERATSPDDAHHRTLVQALTDRKGVCDEIARLKLFALEEIGFKPDDVKWVEEGVFFDGKFSPDGHCVTIARVDDTNWVLNSQLPRLPNTQISRAKASMLMINASAVEPDSSQLNFSRSSYWATTNEVFIPLMSFNSHQFSFYKGTTSHNSAGIPIPAIARTARRESADLGAITGVAVAAEEVHVASIVLSALGTHYDVKNILGAAAPAKTIPNRNIQARPS